MIETRLDPEERAYFQSFGRRGAARLRRNEHTPIDLPYGEIRSVRAGIPDTYFTIPARLRHEGATIKGFLSLDDGVYEFTPEARPDLCQGCAPGEGCKS